jgi:hypothetical protein
LSVLIPTYNGAEYLCSALNSIAEQEVDDIECIAVDDGSADNTVQILRDFEAKFPIKIMQPERKGNWVANTNQALSYAQGEYICFLHQDDIWFKDRLSVLKQLVRQFPAVVLLLHSSYFIDHQGRRLGLWNCPLPAFPEIIKPSLMIERLLVQNFISIPGATLKREVALKVGGLNELLWYTADWDFWLKIAAEGDALYYPKPLSGFRLHLGSQTIVRSSRQQDFRKQLETVANQHFSSWQTADSIKRRIRQVADFSIEMNIALAGTVHGQEINLLALMISFLKLGPLGGYRYIRDSRIWERVSARLKVQLRPAKKDLKPGKQGDD